MNSTSLRTLYRTVYIAHPSGISQNLASPKGEGFQPSPQGTFSGLTAVADFNLALEPNELVGIIGPNGASKTTVFNLITGV
jgi:ABC-type multidrug transport system ATPase subunit